LKRRTKLKKASNYLKEATKKSKKMVIMTLTMKVVINKQIAVDSH